MSHYETHLAKAQEFYDDCNYEGARIALGYALEACPPQGDCRAMALLGHTYRRLEYDDEALKLFEQCLEIQPLPEVLAEVALILAEKGIESERACELAQRACEGDPDSVGAAYLALYLIFAKRGEYLPALRSLKSGIRRGVDYSETQLFDTVRTWCQQLCAQNCVDEAFQITSEVVDFFGNFDFYVLHARIAEFAAQPRIAVEYYKKTLPFLRAGSAMRIDILEAIAKLAI